MKIIYCDNCKNKITKSPNRIVANDRKIEACNDCWFKFVNVFSGIYTLGKTHIKEKKNKKLNTRKNRDG